MKKIIASVGVAAAATAGALLLTGSPASAQTTQATSAPAQAAYVHTVTYHHPGHHPRHQPRHNSRHHWSHRWGYDRDHNRHNGNRNYNSSDTRVVISSDNTTISVND